MLALVLHDLLKHRIQGKASTQEDFVGVMVVGLEDGNAKMLIEKRREIRRALWNYSARR